MSVHPFLIQINNFLEIPSQLARMEIAMASAKQQLNELSSKVDDLVSDVRAAKEALEADRENLSAEGQAALDELTAKIEAFDAEVGDADGSDAANTGGGDQGGDQGGAVEGGAAGEPAEGTENPQAPVTNETPSDAGQTDQFGNPVNQ